MEEREGYGVGWTGPGALMVADLLKLFDVLGVPEDTGLYVCDPLDPDQRFIIQRAGKAVKAELEAVVNAARACLHKRPIYNFSPEWDDLRKALRYWATRRSDGDR